MSNICSNCSFYLCERGGICGQGLSCSEQRKLEECSFKVEGPPAEVQGQVQNFWVISGNRRADQVPKSLRLRGEEVLHYTHTRIAMGKGKVKIVFEIALSGSSFGFRGIFAALKSHVDYSNTYSSCRPTAEKVETTALRGGGMHLRAEYVISRSQEFTNKRLSPAAQRYKKRLDTPASKQLRLFKAKAYSSD